MTPNDNTLAPPALPDVLDVAGLAALLHNHPTTIRSHAAQGLIPGRQVGNRWRFSRAKIEAWLAGDDKAA
jgi:excisionase family DNA binding protein